MAKVSLYKEKKGTICLQFTNCGRTALRFTQYKVNDNQWNKQRRLVINHPRADYINLRINGMLNLATDALMLYTQQHGTKNMSANALRDAICAIIFHENEIRKLFLNVYDEFTKTKHARTHELYITCRNTICAFDKKITQKSIDDIDLAWLQGFVLYCNARQKTNTTNIRLRCIRAVFNYALKMEYTTKYPFRNFQIKQEPIIRHDLTPGQIEDLIIYDIPNLTYNGRPLADYINACRCMFYLIGINAKDLYEITEDNIINGRLKYIRAKTHKPYSILLHESAKSLIYDTISLAHTYSNHRDFMVALNRCLHTFCEYIHIPPITTNWLRHAWATYAQNKCQVPLDIIAQALGHSSMLRITEGYPAKDVHNADDANRLVIDTIEAYRMPF